MYVCRKVKNSQARTGHQRGMGGRKTDDDDTHERHTDTNKLTRHRGEQGSEQCGARDFFDGLGQWTCQEAAGREKLVKTPAPAHSGSAHSGGQGVSRRGGHIAHWRALLVYVVRVFFTSIYVQYSTFGLAESHQARRVSVCARALRREGGAGPRLLLLTTLSRDCFARAASRPPEQKVPASLAMFFGRALICFKRLAGEGAAACCSGASDSTSSGSASRIGATSAPACTCGCRSKRVESTPGT